MQVILLERVERLGQMGEEVKVRPGFARNFLLPKKKALRATDSNREFFLKQKAELEARNLKLKGEAEKLAEKIKDLSVIIVRQASEAGHLFGSVSSRDVADAAGAKGFKIDRSQVVLTGSVKTLGLFKIKIALHPEVATQIQINVARSEEEAKIQAEKGVALIVKEEPKAEDEAVPAETEAAAQAI